MRRKNEYLLDYCTARPALNRLSEVNGRNGSAKSDERTTGIDKQNADGNNQQNSTPGEIRTSAGRWFSCQGPESNGRNLVSNGPLNMGRKTKKKKMSNTKVSVSTIAGGMF